MENAWVLCLEKYGYLAVWDPENRRYGFSHDIWDAMLFEDGRGVQAMQKYMAATLGDKYFPFAVRFNPDRSLEEWTWLLF